MRRLMILNLFIIGTVFSAFAQKTIETYDVNDDKQTTVILRDSAKSDKDILNELDLDDYAVGEEVYITAEMWAQMQAGKKEKEKTNINESPKMQETEMEAILVRDKIVTQKKMAGKPARATGSQSASSTTKAKKKKKKSRKYRVKKPKRKKHASRRGKMACYSF